MRLNSLSNTTICESAQKKFWQRHAYLAVGSRVEDQAKGGDIDLLYRAKNRKCRRVNHAKLLFLRELHKKLGEQNRLWC